MEDTFGKKPIDAPKKDTRRTLPATRPNEQTEAVDTGFAKVSDEGRLKQDISVGRKPEVYSVKPDDVESLRPTAEELKNG